MGVRGRKAEAPGLHQGEGCDDRVVVRERGGGYGGVSLVTKLETRILHCVIPGGIRYIRVCSPSSYLPPFHTILHTPSTHTSYTPSSRFLPPSCTSMGLRLFSSSFFFFFFLLIMPPPFSLPVHFACYGVGSYLLASIKYNLGNS